MPDVPETPLYVSKPMISKEYNPASDVRVEKLFDNKDALHLAVSLKSIQEGFQFFIKKSNPNRYGFKCVHFDQCAWSITSNRWKGTYVFEVTGMTDIHTCPKTQTYPNHRNANKKVIGYLFKDKLKDGKREIKGKDIQEDIMSQYKINISYQKAWRGKEYGLQMIRGSPLESFEMLPYYCYNLERKNPGTVTRIKTNEEGVFEMLFVAIGASIRTFVNHLRPLLIVDGAHLKGLYKGTNLLAVGMDGNNQIVPIAYGICRGETGECWSWWFSVLKECIGDNPDLVIISDRHPAIALAVSNQYPLAFHGICCRHLMMNLSLKKKKTKALYWSICKAYTRDEFERKMHTLQLIQPAAYNKLIEAGVERWSRAHCPRTCYNYCTSNSAESVNNCTRKTRKMSIIMLTESYRSMVQKWYFNRREDAENMKYEITYWAADKVAKRKIKSATWIVHGINQYQFQVYDGRYNRQVNLTNRSCECRKWQLSGIPYGHVIAVIKFLGVSDCLEFIQDWFKKPKYQATYAESVHFVGEFHEWVYPDHIHPITPPRMDNPQPGRPKNTNRILSQGEEPTIIHCSRCGEAGHKREQCKKSFVPDPQSNKHKTKNQQFPGFEHHETPPSFNPSQQYDHGFPSYNPCPSQPYHQDPYPSQTYHQNPFPSQTYHQNQYPSQTYHQNQNQTQTYHQNPYTSQPVHEQNDHQYPSQMYEQYNSQHYGSQHLDDQKTHGSNGWRDFLGF